MWLQSVDERPTSNVPGSLYIGVKKGASILDNIAVSFMHQLESRREALRPRFRLGLRDRRG
jgi:hypothetical protein